MSEPARRDPVADLIKEMSAARRLPADRRARRYRDLIRESRVVLSSAADEAADEAVATSSYRELADLWGVSVAAVNKAVTRHRTTARNQPPPGIDPTST